MSKDRNIDDAELANISGAGDLDIADNPGDGPGGIPDPSQEGVKPPTGSGNVGGPDHNTNSGGDVEFGE